MNKLDIKQALFWDNLHVLSMAIAIWLPCFVQWYFDAATVYHIVTVFLFGTAYLMLTRLVTCMALLFIAVKTNKE